MVGAARLLALGLAVAASGCDRLSDGWKVNEFSGDPFPIGYESADGAIVVGLAESGRTTTRVAVLDVLSPLTVIDRGPDAVISIDAAELTLLGRRSSTGALDVPRARFPGAQVVTLHPCATPQCAVGSDAAPRAIDALIGVDLFLQDALRLRVADQQLFVLPDIAGGEAERSRACDAVMPAPFRGGGTLVIGGTELEVPGRRIAIDACLAFDPAPAHAQSRRGADALLVLSTALGPSLLGESAYERYRLLDPTSIPALDDLPARTVVLPAGPVTGRLGQLSRLALVANSTQTPRAPCRQVYAHHLLAAGDCQIADCPCTGGSTFCGAPAIVELDPGRAAPPAPGFDVLVVPDAHPVLQALRTELRPDRPEVDGLLGTDALRALELDIDPAHGRMLARCLDRATCASRPRLADRTDRTTIDACVGSDPGPLL